MGSWGKAMNGMAVGWVHKAEGELAAATLTWSEVSSWQL